MHYLGFVKIAYSSLKPPFSTLNILLVSTSKGTGLAVPMAHSEMTQRRQMSAKSKKKKENLSIISLWEYIVQQVGKSGEPSISRPFTLHSQIIPLFSSNAQTS